MRVIHSESATTQSHPHPHPHLFTPHRNISHPPPRPPRPRPAPPLPHTPTPALSPPDGRQSVGRPGLAAYDPGRRPAAAGGGQRRRRHTEPRSLLCVCGGKHALLRWRRRRRRPIEVMQQRPCSTGSRSAWFSAHCGVTRKKLPARKTVAVTTGGNQGWHGRGGARGAGRQRAAPPAGARGAAKFRGR